MLKVLTYHKVNSIDIDPLTVKTEMFLRHLDCLENRGFNFILPEDILSNDLPALRDPVPRSVLLTFDDGFSTDYEIIFPLLKAKKCSALFFLVTDFIGKDGMLSLDEIRSIRRAGFSIGSHSVSHPRLTSIPLDQAKREIQDSKKLLEDCVKEEVKFFSYPYGDLNEDIISFVKEAGYKAAFLTSPYRRRYKYSKFTIPRCGLSRDTSFILFNLKLL